MIDAEPLFGVPWDGLTRTHVEAMLAEGETEPLLWEAKGTKLVAGEVREQVCGFANSHEGGFLILGARWDKQAKVWVVDGLDFPDEPALWVGNIVEGVRPRPRVETLHWPVDGDRQLAVVRVEPVPVTPCNAHGVVYERVSGATKSVRDPQRLADLFQRGDAARARVEGDADAVAAWALGELGRWFRVDESMVLGVVALTRTGQSPDIASRLFRPPFAQRLERAADKLAGTAAALRQPIEWTQRALMCAVAGHDEHDRSGAVFATWRGVTAAAFVVPGAKTISPEALVTDHVTVAWEIVEDLQRSLGGYAESFASTSLQPQPIQATRSTGPSGRVEIRRGLLPPGFDRQQVLDSILREASRAAGRPTFEP